MQWEGNVLIIMQWIWTWPITTHGSYHMGSLLPLVLQMMTQWSTCHTIPYALHVSICSGTLIAPCTGTKVYAILHHHFPLNTTVPTSDTSSWTLNSITVEGHTVQVIVWALDHSDFSIGKQPHSKRSQLHSVNWQWSWTALNFFHPSGCTQPMTTQHTPFIQCNRAACTLFTREGQVPVYCSCQNHTKSIFQPKLPQISASNTVYCHSCELSITPCGCAAEVCTFS